MTIIEAVQALKDGRCDGIRRPKGIPRKLELSGEITQGEFHVDSMLADDWQLVNPKPVMETVEVVRWMCPDCDSLRDREVYQCCAEKPPQAIKLTGTYQREVPPKVKRRERINFNGIPTLNNGDSVPKTAIIYAEWEE